MESENRYHRVVIYAKPWDEYYIKKAKANGYAIGNLLLKLLHAYIDGKIDPKTIQDEAVGVANAT
jgi:hypothetical protein